MSKRQKWLLGIGLIVIAAAIGLTAFIAVNNISQKEKYGIFIGMEKKALLDLSKDYDTLVINATRLQRDDVTQVHQQADELYSYLNVGALEKSNSFYQEFSHLILKPYDNWPDEYWVDVTDTSWQDNLLKQAQTFKNKGVDGLFLDNLDIYYQYPNDRVYKSLLNLLKRFKALDMPVIINGGDSFVSRLIEKEKHPDRLIFAINQESVFTLYDFDKKKAKQQEPETTAYYQNYLKDASQSGLKTYLIEYDASRSQQERIRFQAWLHHYHLYLAEDIALDKE